MSGCPRLVIAGSHSGVGKSSLTLALVAALRQRGLTVQTFKVGPDYLDPGHLSRVSGRPCYNLDGWMCGRDYVSRLFAERSAAADIAIIEGVMGLYDGSSPTSLDGSTAQIADWLQAPVALVVNSHGMARSLAALVHGYVSFEPTITLAGVIANFCGSDSHATLLTQALQAASLPPLLGAVPRNALPALPSRHLGLVSATETPWNAALIQQLAAAAEQHLNLDQLLQQAHNAPSLPPLPPAPPVKVVANGTVRLAIARDAAFQFYYQDLFDALEQRGVQLVFFSPLVDAKLPADCNGLYLGGGYPEEHAEQLSCNHTMLTSIRDFCNSGRPVYAECGGLMYLSQGLQEEEKNWPFVGILPSWTRMRSRRQRLGYMEVTLQRSTLFGAAGTRLRGHEFHYSELCDDPLVNLDWEAVYQARTNRDGSLRVEGYSRGQVLVSYVHLHLASSTKALDNLVSML
ncbi:cobyrinate a,c-diamide synthase [Desulfuromonas thiophila]|uniref:Cobyrinate a,c-diamide synthase n=1 Tax=Desulfuromonas thiophila TaxID=57664 RepID=A0A1G7D3F9_9BACT|nr:cobyrinate a,c-diamide synthase [Desulfuromonas thiophila]SDE46047.1 hydrogenobyrinic acid a,c-diamide synthase (glutamine-hydrolysing) /cobyrinate a,c-diamide synthase [Desulfuromonas thiophila]